MSSRGKAGGRAASLNGLRFEIQTSIQPYLEQLGYKRVSMGKTKYSWYYKYNVFCAKWIKNIFKNPDEAFLIYLHYRKEESKYRRQC